MYFADSPIASDSLGRLGDLISLNNLDEASRLVTEIITNHGDRLIESDASDPQSVYIPVRNRIHAFVLSNPNLLASYRTHSTPSAQAWLDADDWQRVTRDAWLTEPGLIATLHYAQTLIEAAHFQAGLRVLNELKLHPDSSKFSKQMTTLSNQATNYLNTNPPTTQTPVATALNWNTHQSTDAISLAGIVPGALASTALTPKPNIDHLQGVDQTRNSGANWNPTSWIMPVAANNMIYTNDGITISCFDRFTLRPVWRLQTTQDLSELPVTADARARVGRIIEDSTTLTIVQNDLYAPAGIPRNGTRAGDTRLFKLNALTGQIQWTIDIQNLDSSLSEASIRGQVIVDQGVVVVGARTNNRKKRLINFAIVGLDATTGKKLWIRQIASAGSLPFQQMGQLAHSPVLHAGVIYWTDHIGLGFAIEAATGQVLWAKPLPSPDIYARFTRPSFSNNSPAVNDFGVFTLSTDGTLILQLDLVTGKTIATQRANPSGESMYLLAAGDSIACVSSSYVTLYSAKHFATTTTSRSPVLGGADGIQGRVIVVHDQIIVPVKDGVQIIDSNRPQAVQKINLDSSGNILTLNGQIIVVDEMNISNYLAWETASTMLKDRIPNDPSAIITLAELAYRAHRNKETIDTVSQAMSVISKQPLKERALLHDQLFAAVLSMVEPAQSTHKPNTSLSSDDQEVLLTHLGTLAQSHHQVVAHRMALGSWNEQRNNMADAIGAYQDILDQSPLSSSMWEGSGIAVRGGLEASRRIRTILNTVGYAPYQKFDQLALSEHNFLDHSTRSDDFEQLAKRYPWASSTPSVWMSVAKLYKGENQRSAMIHAASEGLDTVTSLSDLGVHTDQLTIDQLAEYAISGMISTNRAKDAQTLASTLSLRFPQLTLRIDGEVITNDQIADKARIAAQIPILGDSFLKDDQQILITGSPIKPGVRIDQGGVVLHMPQLGRIEYVRAGRGAFETIWSRQSKTTGAPIIPWQDQARTVILWPQDAQEDNSGTLEAIETTSGKVVWSIENIRSVLIDNSTRIADTIARGEGQFSTPVQGSVFTNQLLVVTDGHTLVVSDRIGRAMGIDLFTGKQLWKIDLPANRVYDIDINGGVLGICGVSYIDQPTQQQEGLITSIAASIDPRTGETIQLIDKFGQHPRWIRVGTNGDLFVAAAQRIVAINTKEGTMNWIFKDDSLEDSTAGWIAGNQLIVLDADTDMWALSLDEGTHDLRPLELRQRVVQRGWIQVRSETNSFFVASSRGFAAFNQDKELVAADSFDTSVIMKDVAWGLNRVAFIQQPQTVDDQSHAILTLLDQQDAQLLDTMTISVPNILGRQPSSLTAITGGLIVGYHEVSIFVRTTTVTQ